MTAGIHPAAAGGHVALAGGQTAAAAGHAAAAGDHPTAAEAAAGSELLQPAGSAWNLLGLMTLKRNKKK
jgi:hypothetical protein